MKVTQPVPLNTSKVAKAKSKVRVSMSELQAVVGKSGFENLKLIEDMRRRKVVRVSLEDDLLVA